MKPSWQTKRLGEICEIELGKTPARANKSFWDENRKTTNVWLSIADLLNAVDNLAIDSKEYLSNKGAAVSKIVRKGTLLVSFKLTLGRMAFAGRDLYTNEAIAALSVLNEREMSKEFLFYFLLFFDWLKAAENDVKIKGMTLNKAKLKMLQIYFPPIPEQRRIVGILDEAFDRIATAKVNAEKNLRNARALFKSQLQAMLNPRTNAWVERPLLELCAVFVDSAHRTPKYQREGIPALRPRDVVNGRLALMDAARVSRQEYQIQSQRHRPSSGDIVYSRELSFGWAALLPESSPSVCLSQGMCLFRPTPELHATFLLYVLNGPIGRVQATRAAVGAAHPHINLSDIKSYAIPVPPLSTQMQIVQKLDNLAATVAGLESVYRQKLTALEELKKSLLHQAFSGDL